MARPEDSWPPDDDPSSSKDWSDAVYFIPSVGPHYRDGLADGKRVLLLGEAHYPKTPEDRMFGRQFTRRNFDDLRRCELQPGNTFWGRIQKLAARSISPTREQANAAWQHVAFANLVQEFVGDGPRQRPRSKQWETGRPALGEMLKRLRPHVVLILGAGTWNHIEDGDWSSEPPIIPSSGPQRSIWLLAHPEGNAKATWVYHPSSGRERIATSIEVFEALLDRVRAT